MAAISMAVVGIGESAASATVCSGGGAIFDRGGEVNAVCSDKKPFRDGIDRGGSEEARWNAYCTDFMNKSETYTYVVDSVVDIHNVRALTEEQVERFGYNPTGVYGSFVVTCYHASGVTGDGGTFTYTITDPISIDDLLDEVKERIRIDDPVIDSNPSFSERFAVVRIPTWLWVDLGYWEQENSEDETRGFVTVEVWAEPDALDWAFTGGDYELECPEGPGTPWTSEDDEPECSVLFRRSSAGEPGDAFTGEATVSWQFYWTLNGADQGPFDELLELTTAFDIQVGEILSVET